MNKNKSLEFDACCGSEIKDSTGETLIVSGADTDDFHIVTDNHGTGFFNNIGRITEHKKIFSESDCENERHKHYWNKVKAPYIYAKGYLYDSEDHPNAKAAAAILRNIHKEDCPLQLKASVEGGIVSRGIKDKNLLERTKIKGVALTFTPANSHTLVEPLNLKKSLDENQDMVLIKSVVHLAKERVPSFRHIERYVSAVNVQDNIIKINELAKKLNLNIQLDNLLPKDLVEAATCSKIASNLQKADLYINDLEDEELKKGLKNLLTSMAIGAGLMGGLAGNIGKEDIDPHKDQREKELKAIYCTESSCGQNLYHPTIKAGINKGHKAGSGYGITPYTLSDVFKNDPMLAKKWPKMAELLKDVKHNHKAITNTLNADHDFANEAANSFHKQISTKFPINKYSPEVRFHAWNEGTSGTYSRLKDKSIPKHAYVKKVMTYYNNPDMMNKSLCAGYGGAGSPMGLTGGGVIQAQSLEPQKKPKKNKKNKKLEKSEVLDKDDSFRYITCHKCGDEQVMGKYQVRCRECGKNFSAHNMYNAMSVNQKA